MRIRCTLILSVLFFAACADEGTAPVDEDWGSTPYVDTGGKGDLIGGDSRFEVHDPNVPQVYRQVAESTALIFSTLNIADIDANTIRLNSRTMNQKKLQSEGMPLCSTERFRDDAAPGYCTGFLIGPDLVATAGHCVNGHTLCQNMAFAFGFSKDNPSDTALTLPREDFYRCETIVGQEYDQGEQTLQEFANGELWQDWAVIKLDRPVTGRRPLPVDLSASPAVGESVTAVGHPSGLAMKVTRGKVVSNANPEYYTTDLDIYKGNSGSPVVDTSGVVRGIVVRGSGGASFIENNGCLESKVCDAVGPRCLGNQVLHPKGLAGYLPTDLRIHTNFDRPQARVRGSLEHDIHIDANGPLTFVTMNMNGFSMDPKKLKFELTKVGSNTTLLMERPKKFNKGTTRYTRTTTAFNGQDAEGTYRLRITDLDGDASARVDWLQIVVGTSQRPVDVVETRPAAWVGTACDSDSDCDFSESGSPGLCFEFGSGVSYCTVPCEGFCPDRAGHATTFCVASDSDQTGVCASRPAAENAFCATIPGSREVDRERFIGSSSAPATSRSVCE